jgi:outer membrane protein OmpA-like peptidoglycan-associated protein
LVPTIRATRRGRRVRLEGHTDSREAPKRAVALSQARAEAVVRYLSAHGVDRSRLIARGFGPTRPLASNATRAGREANRRVEFRVVERRPNLDNPEPPLPPH